MIKTKSSDDKLDTLLSRSVVPIIDLAHCGKYPPPLPPSWGYVYIYVVSPMEPQHPIKHDADRHSNSLLGSHFCQRSYTERKGREFDINGKFLHSKIALICDLSRRGEND